MAYSGMPYYGMGDAISDAGRDLGQIGGGIAQYLVGEDKRKKDEDYLNWLTGQVKSHGPDGVYPVPDRAAAPASPAPQMADLGMGQSDSSAPAMPPAGNIPGPSPEAMQSAQKATTGDLFSSPEDTLGLLVEAKRQGVSEDMGSLMQFIAKQHETASEHAFKSEERKAADKEKADLEQKRSAARAKAAIDAQHFQQQRDTYAAGVRLKIAGMQGKKGKLDEKDVEAMSDPELDALSNTLSEQEGKIADPEPPKDEYDVTGIMHYRDGLKEASQQRMEVYKLKSAIERAKAIREAKPGKPGVAPTHAAPTPTKRGVYNPATGKIEYR